MLVLKKKEIIAAALVVMIGVAGYLNWSYQDTVRVTDSENYIQTGKKLGEAKYVDSKSADVEETSGNEDFFEEAKLEKEAARSKSLEILKDTAQNESFDEKTRSDAQQRILDMAKNTETETAIENAARAKGYDEISVYIDGKNADVIVKKDNFDEKDANVIKQIICEHSAITADGIKIVSKK